MKRNVLLVVVLFAFIGLKAQHDLNFNKRFVQCEDKWVAFKMSEDSTYQFGFIYIDEQAGLTYNMEGSFKINSEDVFIPQKMDSINVKVRLEPNRVKVAIIPENRYKELMITETPDWLKYYKQTEDTVGRMVRWGFFYNAWDECEKALTYLEKAYQIDPHHSGLEFELSYAYNALEQFDKAILILNEAIKNNPKECLFYKELSYAQCHTGKLNDASITSEKALSVCTEKELKAEISYNLAYQYYLKKDKANFKKWAKIAKKNAKGIEEVKQMIDNLNTMEDKLNK